MHIKTHFYNLDFRFYNTNFITSNYRSFKMDLDYKYLSRIFLQLKKFI